jgi:hypothetical protein
MNNVQNWDSYGIQIALLELFYVPKIRTEQAFVAVLI